MHMNAYRSTRMSCSVSLQPGDAPFLRPVRGDPRSAQPGLDVLSLTLIQGELGRSPLQTDKQSGVERTQDPRVWVIIAGPACVLCRNFIGDLIL